MTIINYDSVCPAVLLELFFKASAYNGVTFETKINPSNSIVIDSENVKLAATADSVYVSCWEYYKMKKNIGSFMRVRMIIVLDNIISR